jgi:N-ethylmaleimide reductase
VNQSMFQDPLFAPACLGALALGHRVAMAPLTRMRSRQPGDVPQPINEEYYRQRASRGGLIITEATDISEQARAYTDSPFLKQAAQPARSLS